MAEKSSGSAESVRRKYPSGQQERYMVRFPDGMRERIKGHADKNGQSLNTAIIMALDAVYPEPAEPESVNQKLLQSAMTLAGQWSAALEAMGADPEQHPALQKFFKDAQEAMEAEK